MKKLLLSFMSILMPLIAGASVINFTYVDGIYYKFYSGSQTAEVTCAGYQLRIDADPDDYTTGDIQYRISAGYSGSLEIPSEVTYNGVTYKVTSIMGYAFTGCSELTSVSIPNNVEFSISCFWGSALYDNQPDGLFYMNNVLLGYKGDKPTGAITIREGTSKIGALAFSSCSGLTSVTIPNSVKSIESYAFYNCSGLTSVTIPNSVESIGESAFSSCSGLTSVTIPNSVKSIESYTFYGCSCLTSVTIPNSVESIGEAAFWCCSSLASITFSGGVREVGSSAFDGTVWYDNQPDGLVYIDKVAYKYKGVMPENTSISIKDGTSLITLTAFSGCSGLTSVTIPNSVTNIGTSLFRDCSSLTSINVQNGNTKYDSRNNCNGIIETESNTLIIGCKNTIIPDGVTSIGSDAFYNCSGLTSVTIPNSVESIGISTFFGCSNLTEVIALPLVPPTLYDTSFPYEKDLYVFKGFDSKIKLVLPEAVVDTYMNCYPWNKFATIETLSGERLKCATPTISFKNGQVTFACETEGVTYNYTIISSLSGLGSTGTSSSSVGIGSGITVEVTASKTGYTTSDKATKTLPISIQGDLNGDGEVDVADHVELSKIIMKQQ